MNTRAFSKGTVALGGVALAVAAASIGVFAVVLGQISTHAYDATGDFLAFYAAGYMARTGEATHLYNAGAMESAQRLLFPGGFSHAIGYPLPVFVAWLFAPLSALSFTAAYFVYVSLLTLLLVALLVVLYRQLHGVPAAVRWLFVACAGLSMPSLAAIVFGQVDLIALAGLIAAYLCLRAGRRRLAGLALCLVLVKPHLLVGIALLLLVRRDWRTLGVLCGVGAPLLVLPALLAGPSTLLDNVRAMFELDQQLIAGARVAVMPNWRGFIDSLTHSDTLLYWAPGAVAIAAGAIAIAIGCWRRALPAAFDRDYSLAVLLPLIASPHVHTQSLSLLMLPGALALRAYLGGTHSGSMQNRATQATLLIFTLLFALPFLAIQGLSLTVFLLLGCYLAAASRWPHAESAADSESAPSPARAA